MRVCVVGAGAIGGHLAARLAEGGAAVSVLARGATLAALHADGLRVETPQGTLRCRPTVSDDPHALGVQDAVVLCTKVTAYPEVASSVAALLGPDSLAVCVANGVPWWYFGTDARVPEGDPNDALRDAVGLRRAFGGVVWSACTVQQAGVVRVVSRSSRLVLGGVNGTTPPVLPPLAALFVAGGLPCTVSADVRHEVWDKLVGNLANGPLCLLSRRDLATTYADPAIRAAAERCATEAIAIAAAYGYALPNPPADRVAGAAATPHKPSILQDLEAGRPTEFASLLAAPLRLARERGVATPTLDLLVALAGQALEASGRSD